MSHRVMLIAGAQFVLTDSGGVLQESAHQGVPCLMLQPNTERPVTVELGTSIRVANDLAVVESAFGTARGAACKNGRRIPLRGGFAAGRVADNLERWVGSGTGASSTRDGSLACYQ